MFNFPYYNPFEKIILNEKIIFPAYEAISDDLIAIGGDYNPYRLLLAYSLGIFPWPASPDEPIYWACPRERMVIYPENFKISKSLSQSIRNKNFELRIDTCFRQVIETCSHINRKAQTDTWIFPKLIDAYEYLHHLGLVHSFEIFQQNKLVGGLYGLSLGAVFFGESMFSKVPDASKVALHYLVECSKKWNFRFIDTQVYSAHLQSLGATEISRTIFLKELKIALKTPTKQGKWTDFTN